MNRTQIPEDLVKEFDSEKTKLTGKAVKNFDIKALLKDSKYEKIIDKYGGGSLISNIFD